jgi:dTDP-4-amino-4,6-dideoxygalactose transaminase
MIIPSDSASVDVSAVPLLDVSRGNQPLKTEFMEAFSSIIDCGQFIGGPYVKSLEESVAAASDAQFGVACASGSDALLLALMAIGVGRGDEVICPSFTFFATASAIVRVGAVPVFIDINPMTFNLDHTKLEGLITPRTKAIIPVHLFGQCCAMDRILDIARRHQLHVIEDCAQSIGASDRGRRAGGMGSIGCFSFYPTKNIGCFGDGGMLTTNDAELAKRMRLLANHGMSPRYYHQVVGINSRLDAMQAAVLMIKMRHLDQSSQQRVLNAKYYQQLIQQTELEHHVVMPQCQPGNEHVWNQFTIRIRNGQRDLVREKLGEAKIGTEIYYPLPLHQQECFRTIPVRPNSLTETENAAREVLALPIFPELTRAEQEYVVETLARILVPIA